MNILFVNNIFPLFAHADSGASVRSMRLIKALTKLGHVDVISFLDNEVSNVENCDVIYSKLIHKVNAFKSRKDKFRLLLHHSSHYDVFPENKEKSTIVDYYVLQKQYDFIVTRYIDMACDCGLLKYAERLIIDVDDDPESVAKMFGRKLRSTLNRWYQVYFYSRFVGQATYKILPTIYHAFNSEPLRSYPNTDFLPNISLFSEPLPNVQFSETPNNILFVGRMDHMPNVLSLEYFLRDVFPLILKANPKVHLRVVGRIDKPELLALCKGTPNVVLCGFVEDIKEEYRKCRCAVIPLLHGTGTSVKLIEAMSLNRAVVTTTIGKRGLHEAFEAGEDFLLADDDVEFANAVIKLLNNETLNVGMSNNAQHKIERYYSENRFNEIVKNAIFRSNAK